MQIQHYNHHTNNKVLGMDRKVLLKESLYSFISLSNNKM